MRINCKNLIKVGKYFDVVYRDTSTNIDDFMIDSDAISYLK